MIAWDIAQVNCNPNVPPTNKFQSGPSNNIESKGKQSLNGAVGVCYDERLVQFNSPER